MRLNREAEALINASNEARIEFIKREKWICYEAADRVLKKLEYLFEYPTTHRMPNLLIEANTNNGKSHLLAAFCRRHPIVVDPDSEVTKAPVLIAVAPPGPDEVRLYKEILAAVNAPYPAKSRADCLFDQIKVILPKLGCRMLIIDEVHDLISGSSEQHRKMLKIIKFLGNKLKIPIVGAGINVARNAFQSDDQVANRFEPISLPKWKLSSSAQKDGPFEKLVVSLASLFPLRKAESLNTREILMHLWSKSEGLIGEIVALTRMAAIEAIQSGEETISIGLLKRLPYLSPAERRERQNKMVY